MLEIVIGAVFLAAFLITLAVHKTITRGQAEVEQRVTRVVGSRIPSIREQELKVPLYIRAVKPVIKKYTGLLTRSMPAEKEADLGAKIERAGISDKIAPRELFVLKYAAAAGFTFLFWLLGGAMAKSITQTALIACAGLALGWYFPDLYLNSKGSERKREIEKGLPDVLDLLTVSVEAGLGFDSALIKVTEKSKGVLSDEFRTMLQEIKMGKSRVDALRDLSKRADVDDLSTFTGSIILADQLGISIGNVLRLQSEQMRQKHRQRSEEMAMKTPIKIIFPLVFFIFPAIFIVLLGPALIQMSDTIF
ncbi:MAG: type II secretion system F family protein [Desulfotomaculaceae bacterium]|nr:type II secretion system F family protein [Desulfotomaculaceae bacterium]